MPAKGMMDRPWTHNDYPKYWQNVTDNSLRSDLTNSDIAPNRHICKGDYFTMESVYWFHRRKKNVIIYTRNKRQNTRTKIIQRQYQMHNYTPRMSDRPIWSLHFMHTDLLGNTDTLKVDRNLQWKSHHPTNPTHNPVLSGTMTHLSARCLNSTTRTHNTNTYTQKVCIRYLTYCMPPLW